MKRKEKKKPDHPGSNEAVKALFPFPNFMGYPFTVFFLHSRKHPNPVAPPFYSVTILGKLCMLL